MAKKKGKKVGGARPGAGAKRKLKGATIMSISFDAESLRRLDQYAKRKKCKRSKAIRLIIAEVCGGK